MPSPFPTSPLLLVSRDQGLKHNPWRAGLRGVKTQQLLLKKDKFMMWATGENPGRRFGFAGDALWLKRLPSFPRLYKFASPQAELLLFLCGPGFYLVLST